MHLVPPLSSCVSSLSSSRDFMPSVGPMITMAIVVVRVQGIGMTPKSMLL